ncbi:MAG: DUF4276 family protein [Deltaproteobacteria bacterium]|nr:DUF4276 family protein [Deltaproteobacteria bacterium]
MPTLGIVAAGVFDGAVLRVLARKCRKDVKPVFRQCRGSVLGRGAGIVRDLTLGRWADAIVIVEDAEDRLRGKVQHDIEKRLKNIASSERIRVTVVVAVQMMEAWLLADRDAVASVVGSRVKLPEFNQPEKIRHPKQELTRLLSKAKISYTSQQAARLADAADVRLIRERCPSFERFCEAVSQL